MMEYRLIYYRNPILDAVSSEYTEFGSEAEKFCAVLTKFMKKYDGVGLAANQIGVMKRVVSIGTVESVEKPFCLFNPVITEYSEEKVVYEEGCLSFPQLYFPVERPASVQVKWQDASGAPRETTAEGVLARVLQHEIDHINGITYVKRIPFKILEQIEDKLREIDRKYNG